MTALFYSIELVCSLVIITISAASVILKFYKSVIDKQGDSGKGAGMVCQTCSFCYLEAWNCLRFSTWTSCKLPGNCFQRKHGAHGWKYEQ